MEFENNENISNDNLMQESQEALQPDKKSQKLKTQNILFAFMFIFAAVFLSSLYVFNIFITPIKVVGISMQPTINHSVLNDEDFSHCDVVYYKKQKSYSHNDIIIASNPKQKYVKNENVEFFIKRIVACGGDTVKIIPENNIPIFVQDIKMYYTIEVYNNAGEKILSDEEYIKEEMFYYNYEPAYEKALEFETFKRIFNAIKNGQTLSITIPENAYFVMGDNRNNSTDSRVFGCLDNADVAGVVELHIEYGETMLDAILEKLKIA